MKKNFVSRAVAFFSVIALLMSSFSGYATEKTVAAAEKSSNTPLIAASLDALATPSVKDSEWSGSYIFFGKENGSSIKWRVLDKTGSGGNSSMSGGLLLQADKPVSKTDTYENALQWLSSDTNGFLKNFTALEKDTVMATTSTVKVNSPISLLTATALSGQKVFLPDAGDLATAAYGYRYSNGSSNTKIESSPLWWLRSGYSVPDKGAQGCVLPGDMLFYSFDDAQGQIVPMLNIEKEKILFLSAPSFNKSGAVSKITSSDQTDWKLTLLDSSISVNIENDSDDNTAITRSGNDVTVPYVVTDDSQSANQLSLLITEGTYKNGTILYYGKVADLNGPDHEGEFTFTLPDTFTESSHHVYIVAENAAGGQNTDYAGTPAEVDIPPLHVHSWAGAWSYDEDAHWHECIGDVPGCGLEDDTEKDAYDEHDFEEIVTLEPTCTSTGLSYEKCTVCGYTTEEEETEPLDHEADEEDEGTIIQEPTCEEDGIVRYTCILCGQLFEEEIDALGHDIDNWKVVKEATFLEEGLMRGTCTVCGSIEEQVIPAKIESHKHEYTITSQKNATCEAVGSKTYTCTESQCGHSYTEQIPALGHQWDGWKTIVAATETKTGSKQRTCTRCRKVESQTIPVLPHTHKYNKDLWGTSASSHWNLCSCGAKGDESAHNWNKGTVAKKPTKTQEGQITYTCRQCKYSTTRPLPVINTKIASGKYIYQFTGIKNGTPTATLLGFQEGKTSKTVKVPETIKAKGGALITVTKIQRRAFIRRWYIRKIVIPDTVEEIGNMAFFRAGNVTNITLGRGIKKIGNHAFCHMPNLKTFKIKSTYLKKTKEINYFHGMKTFQIYVPKKKRKLYQKLYQKYDNKVTALYS